MFTLVINNNLSFPVPCNSELCNTNQCFFKVLLSSELFITYLLSSNLFLKFYIELLRILYLPLWYAYLFNLTYEEHSYQTCLGTLKWGHH